MAQTTVNSANQVDQWQKRFFKEYVRATRFNSAMGKSTNAIIQLNEDLGRMAGDDITMSLVTRLTNSGVTGDNTLMGNEEALGNYGHKITVDQVRNAVVVGKMEQQKTFIGLLAAAREQLKMWAMSKLRDDIIARMWSPNTDGTTTYANSTAAQRDAWLDANYTSATNSRVQFGAVMTNVKQTAPAGGATNDHSASLDEIDNTTDQLTPAGVSLARRLAKTADPHIRPVRIGQDEEWYVLYAGSLPFRDLNQHATMTAANRDARTRGENNPLFSAGDLLWDGVIIKEIPEIGVVANAAINCGANFLCGAQALGIAWASRTKAIEHIDDYKNQHGVGVAEIRGVEKLTYNDVDHGLFTYYTAAVADT